MSQNDIDFIRQQLKSAFPASADQGLTTDLWPRMLRRLAEPRMTFGWFEAILVGLVVITLATFPDLLPAMLYHL